MVRAIIVDDEIPAIRALQYLLDTYADIDVIATFTDPLQLLAEVGALQPEVIFLDIEMRGTSGLHVAEQLYALLPQLHIVFVTAYNEYAISAFEVGAIDYLLKPVSQDRIDKTIRRIVSDHRGESPAPAQVTALQTTQTVLHIRCFGHVHVSIETAAQREAVTWRTAKAAELFALFMHYYGRPLHKDVLIEQLWPDLHYDNALMQLHTAVYQIRKLLKHANNGSELRYHHDSYHLLLTAYTYDVERFKEMTKEIEAVKGGALLDIVQQVQEMYTEHYLAGNAYVWSAEESRHLADVYYGLLSQVVHDYIAARQMKEAIPYLRLLIEHNPLHEGYYRQLLSVYAELHDYASVKELYSKLVQALESEWGESPHPDTIAHYERLVGVAMDGE